MVLTWTIALRNKLLAVLLTVTGQGNGRNFSKDMVVYRPQTEMKSCKLEDNSICLLLVVRTLVGVLSAPSREI